MDRRHIIFGLCKSRQLLDGSKILKINFAGLKNGYLDLCSPHMVCLTEKREEEQKSEGQYNVNYTNLPEKYLAMGVLMHNH